MKLAKHWQNADCTFIKVMTMPSGLDRPGWKWWWPEQLGGRFVIINSITMGGGGHGGPCGSNLHFRIDPFNYVSMVM